MKKKSENKEYINNNNVNYISKIKIDVRKL